ncbi:MAG: tetratricopeptide repeat protein, partial [Pirellulaceae bacterium]
QARIQLLEYDKALKTLDQALESRMVLSLQATCFRSIDRVDEAREHLDRSIQMFVDNPLLSGDEETVYQEARRLKGTLLIEEKQYAQARGIMETLCSEYPFDAKSLYKLIQAYRGLGMEKEATEKMKIYEPLRAKRERFSNLHLEAIAQPKNADTRYELGNLSLELGEFQLAFNWFKAALFIDPQHEKTVTAMNKLYGVPGEQTPASTETQPPASSEPAAKKPASTTKKPAADAPKP